MYARCFQGSAFAVCFLEFSAYGVRGIKSWCLGLSFVGLLFRVWALDIESLEFRLEICCLGLGLLRLGMSGLGF